MKGYKKRMAERGKPVKGFKGRAGVVKKGGGKAKGGKNPCKAKGGY